MRNYKKYLAAVLAATMTVGAPAVVMAADVSGVTPTDITDVDQATGTIGGTGALEGVVSTDVFKITVTAPLDGDGFYDFILDPQKLISATDGAAYTGKDFEDDKTLYFKNTVAGAAHDYSATSDPVSITNKGTLDVDVSVKATVTGFDAEGGVALTEDSTFADSTDPSVYLAMKDSKNQTAAMVSGTTGVSLGTTLEKAGPANLWIPVYGANGYAYEEDPNVTGVYKDYSFTLTGASNPNGEWLDAEVEDPAVSVVWRVVPHVADAAPSIATTSYANTGAAIEVTVDLGRGNKAATGIDSITYTNSSGNETTLATENYTFSNNVLRFSRTYISGLTVTRAFKVKFNDTAGTEVTINVTK